MYLTTLLPLLLLIPSAIAQTCNGNAALCDRKYSNVTLIGAHDSAFVGVLPTDNQYLSLSDQLDKGIRFLQAQTHLKDGVIQLCHTKCSLRDAGPLLDYLTTVNEWMNANPNEVVTILLTNPDGATASAFGAVMQASGLSTWAYSPGSKLTMTQWPTLQTMISNGDRLVMFLDYEADTASVPYILDEFAYFFETAYDETDSSFPSCVLDRPSNSNGSGLMMLVNHYLDLSLFGILIPNAFLLPQTNAATGKGSVGAQADLCLQTWGRVPNVILVDFFSAGNVFAAQNTLNGL